MLVWRRDKKISDYTQTTDFSAKDSLSTGDPEKIILGADFDAEFDAISTAIASKYDSSDLANQAQAEAASANDVLLTPLRLDNWAADNAGMVKDIQALADPGADTLLGWDDSASATINFTLGDGLTASGTEIISDAGAVDTKSKSAITSRSSTTTLTDDPHLAGWVLEENATYAVEGWLKFSCDSATPDADIAFETTGTGISGNMQYLTADTADGGETFATQDEEAEVTIAIPSLGATMVKVTGYIQGPTSGGSGTADFQWAQNSSSADAVSLSSSSWIRFTKLP